MTRQGRLRRRFWKLFPLLQLVGCGQVVLQTTDETVTTTNPSITDAGIVNDSFYVSGATLNDPCGKPVVMRGVNEMPTFIYLAKDGSSCFGEITQTGANAIRLYWQTSDSPQDLDRLLLNAEAKRMLPVIYVFNDTSNPTTTFDEAATYWTRSDIVPVVIKHRQWLIIALRERNASETALNTSAWASSVDSAVQRIRAAGINVPLAVDAPQYGMDTTSLVQLGPARIQADPRQNVIFSITAWWANADSTAIDARLRDVINAGLPMMVGEFSGWAQSASNSDCLNIRYDYATIIRVGQETSTGWFAWSWGAAINTYPCTTFNMTSDGRYATLFDWGYNVAVADPNSIHNTSTAATFVPGAGCP